MGQNMENISCVGSPRPRKMVEAVKCYQFPGIPLHLSQEVTVGCSDEGLLEVKLFQTQSSECSALSAEKCAIEM